MKRRPLPPGGSQGYPRSVAAIMAPRFEPSFMIPDIGSALALGLGKCAPLLRYILVLGNDRSNEEISGARSAVLSMNFAEETSEVHALARKLDAESCREAALALEREFPGITRSVAGFDP